MLRGLEHDLSKSDEAKLKFISDGFQMAENIEQNEHVFTNTMKVSNIHLVQLLCMNFVFRKQSG